MFCPACGTESNGDIKYCKRCGTNLRRVKGVLGKGGANVRERAEWEEEWLNEKYGKSPEEKRLHEIKAGVIVSSVGLGLLIFLGFLFTAIANSLPAGAEEKEILRAIPAVGILPLLIGLGIILNGVVIGKRIVALKNREAASLPPQPMFPAQSTAPVPLLEEARSPAADFSIAEPTTKTLRDPLPVSKDTH